MNTNVPLNYQPKITMGGFGVDSIPFSNWRETLVKDGTVQYSHQISGNALLECEDGRLRSFQIEVSLYGKKRFSALGGLVAAWHARPSRGKTHAQCKVIELASGSTAFDGPVTFTEPEIITPTGAVSPELGLVYKADITKGKTIQFVDAELKQKLDSVTGKPVTGKDGTLYFVISHKAGEAVVDRPKAVEIDDGEVATVSAEPVSVRAAARKSGGNAAAPSSAANEDPFQGAV